MKALEKDKAAPNARRPMALAMDVRRGISIMNRWLPVRPPGYAWLKSSSVETRFCFPPDAPWRRRSSLVWELLPGFISWKKPACSQALDAEDQAEKGAQMRRICGVWRRASVKK